MPAFDPIDLDLAVTPASTLHVLEIEKDYLKALVMAFRLNEAPLLRQVFERIPHSSIALVVEELPVVYVQRLLRFVAMQAEDSPHLEFCLLWVQAILDSHGQWVGDNRGSVDSELRIVSRSVGKIRDELRRLTEENCFMIDYLLSQPQPAGKDLAQNGLSNGQKAITNDDTVELNMDEDEEDAEWMGLD
jgi:periodic tryptophan protein 2